MRNDEPLTIKPMSPGQAVKLWNLISADINEQTPNLEVAMLVLQDWPWFPDIYESSLDYKERVLFASAFLEQWAEELKLLGHSIVEEPPKKRKRKGEDDE